MALPSTIQDRDFNNFEDRGGGLTNRFVTDTETHTKLDAVISAIGGTSGVTPVITNFSATLANTEYSFVLPGNCKGFLLKSRNKATIKFGYATGVLANYLTIQSGAIYSDDHLYLAQTIYFSSSDAANIIEIVTFA